MTLRVEWVDGLDAFVGLSPEWEALAERSGYPFLRHEWFRAFWESYADVITPAVVTVRDGDSLRGALPLQRRGRSLHALGNEHTPVFAPLAADDEALEAVLDAALRATPELVLDPVPADERAVDVLAALSARHRRSYWAEPWIRSPVISTDGTWEAYRKAVGRNARKECERRARRLADIGGTVEALVPPSDAAAEIQAGLVLEAAGWKGAAGTAILDDSRTAAFYLRLGELYHRRGGLLLSTIRVDGKLISWGYNIVDFDRVWTLKGAIDEDYKHVAPGFVATWEDVKQTYARGLDAYELLGDFEPWKERFATDSRPHVIARSYARRPGTVARAAYRRHVRPRLKSLYGRVRRRGLS